MSVLYNLIRDGVDDCAQGVKWILIRGGSMLSVYVHDNGDVLTERANDSRRSKPLPAEMLVGIYNKRCKQVDIADDLHCRLQELLREEAA